MNNKTVHSQNVNRMGISQYHNTIPFYKGDFQYLEKNLKKLETLNDEYDYYYYSDIDLDKFQDKENTITSGQRNSDNLGKIFSWE